MITNKTKAVKDEVVDANSGVSLAKTYGNHKRAIQISEIINAHLAEEDKQAVEFDSEEEAEEFANNANEASTDPVEVKESSVLNK